MILKKDLNALKTHIRVIGKKVDNLLKAYKKEVKTKPAKKAFAKKRATKLTATDKILKIVNRSKKGVDNFTLMKKTGFDERKVRNIIFRAYKEGKIQRAGRGLYIGLKATAPEVPKEKDVKPKPSVSEPIKIGAAKLTATDQVLKIVNTSKKGVDIITIKKKTGLEDKKVRNIIFKTHKEGKIQRAGRGIYIGAK
jgi:predicted transcriptional regulator of viral defense system